MEPKVLPRTGTYAVLITPGSTTTGSMTIALFDVPPDVTATIATNATPVSVTTTIPGQNVRLTFAGTANQRVSLLVNRSFSGCFDIKVLHPNGLIQIYSGSNCSSTALFSDFMVLPVTGTYTIEFNPGGAVTGVSTFTLYDVPPDAAGTIATNGTPVSLTTTAPGQTSS
jgi:hypothetical protein